MCVCGCVCVCVCVPGESLRREGEVRADLAEGFLEMCSPGGKERNH